MNRSHRKSLLGAAGALLVLGIMAGGHLAMAHTAATRPSPADFGVGPRVSAGGRYTATLIPPQPLRPRKMQTIQLTLKGADGRPIEGAQITVDGRMPQHGHGLPTRPRVTRALGPGSYEIDGVRFNMGGWWVFTVSVTGPSGPDVITFNLDL